MIIQYLQISNILSFKHCENINDAEKITFDEGLNIIIGENGAGKSTALEVINFIFKRVLFRQFSVNQDFYSQRNSINVDQKRQILNFSNENSYTGFRLEPNWNTIEKPQIIRMEIKLDEIDKLNLLHIRNNMGKLNKTIGSYTNRAASTHTSNEEIYTLDVNLNNETKNFSVSLKNGSKDFGFEYLLDYNFFKESIDIHNLEHPEDLIVPLYESFTLISGYRNYHAFNRSISLKDQHPVQQIQSIKSQEYSKSINTIDQKEPSIFGLVRLRVAEKHFDLISQKFTEQECEVEANKLPFIITINKKLKIINLKCKIRLLDLRTWQYSFEFIDLRRGSVIKDINSLSSGQKAIVHLVFEAYGRGDLKGGVIIIDEPEIHLHYQLQNEYLQVINEINIDQKCQYILVTHSEAMINSSTINNVKRFSLNKEGCTEIKAPHLTTDQKTLIKILDNTRSTYAFFAKKVLLVEGDTDRFFFKSIIKDIYPEFDQEIAILYMGGKTSYEKWKNLFESFGLLVYFIADFDFIVNHVYPDKKGIALKNIQDITNFKTSHFDWEQKIDDCYANKIFILKNGCIEHYMGIEKKGLTQTIAFCNTRLTTYLKDDSNEESKEIRKIIEHVAK